MPPAAATSVPKRAIAIRRRASRPPAAAGGKVGCRRHGGLPVAGAARAGIGRAVRRSGRSRGESSRGLAGDAAVDASAALVRPPCGAAARIRRDPDVGRASEVIMNNAHGFSTRMRYARKKTLLMASDRLGVPATAVAAPGDFRCGRRAGKEGIESLRLCRGRRVSIAVIVCFLPRPADARDAPDVRSAQPVPVS